MKILIFVTVWKRPEVTDLTYSGLDRIQSIFKEEGIDSEVLIVSSEDYHTEKAKNRGYHVIEVENFPIGTKMNKGIEHALTLDWDCMMRMDSNNLLSNLYIRNFIAAYKEGFKVFGASRFFAIQPDNVHCRIFDMKRGFGPVGMGVKREVIEDVDQWFDLDINYKLDGSFWTRVVAPYQKKDSSSILTIVSRTFPAVMDIKTGEDLNEHKGKKKGGKDWYIRWWPELKNWIK